MSKKGIPVLTVDVIPGKKCEYLGCVSASCCLSKSLVQDVASNVKNWTVGGELTRYTDMIDDAVNLVTERLGVLAQQIVNIVGNNCLESSALTKLPHPLIHHPLLGDPVILHLQIEIAGCENLTVLAGNDLR